MILKSIFVNYNTKSINKNYSSASKKIAFKNFKTTFCTARTPKPDWLNFSLEKIDIPNIHTKRVKIVEVGPRDGLQNEPTDIPTSVKIDLINRLSKCGFQTIEATSFVSPTKIPQMRDNFEVLSKIDKLPFVSYPVLVPNMHGYESAVKAGAKEIAIFTSASESFCTKNINCTINKSFERFDDVIKNAKADNIRIRGYVSCVVGCPYEGYIKPTVVADVAARLYDKGCYEISLGDTIGVGTPASIVAMINAVKQFIPVECLAGHFHNTYGTALPNILVAIQMGVNIFDSSVAGLGGCPYAKGSTGNVPTEDVVYLLHGMGIKTGINLPLLVETAHHISSVLGRLPVSRVGFATRPDTSS